MTLASALASGRGWSRRTSSEAHLDAGKGGSSVLISGWPDARQTQTGAEPKNASRWLATSPRVDDRRNLDDGDLTPLDGARAPVDGARRD